MFATAIRCNRSAWKGPYFVAFPNLREAQERNVPIFTKARACTVLPAFIGIRFHVHNGKSYVPVHITPEMVGHKLGEFSPTRRQGKKPPPPDKSTQPRQQRKNIPAAAAKKK